MCPFIKSETRDFENVVFTDSEHDCNKAIKSASFSKYDWNIEKV